MSNIPGARVVRGGTEDGERAGAEGVRPIGPVMRLAPRALPRSLVVRILLGNPFTMFGLAFAALGMAFVAAFLPTIDLSFAKSYDRQASATITGVEDTHSSENKRSIYRVRYTFHDAAGVERRGQSYTTNPPSPGARTVDYQSGDPSESRLQGMRAGETSPFGALVLLFPLVGLGFGLWPLRRARRNLRLLRYGREVHGKLVDKREANWRVNNVTAMALTFAYEVDGKPYTATVETLKPAVLEDEAREAMLYDPYDPSHATTLDHLPGTLMVNAAGELESLRVISFHLLIAPVAFVGFVVATVIRMV